MVSCHKHPLLYCYIAVLLYQVLLGYNSEWNKITKSHKWEWEGVLKVVEYTRYTSEKTINYGNATV